MSENLYTPNCIRTYSGHYLDPFNPDPALINIHDIAIGLSRTPRFAGQTKHFYSVLSHSVMTESSVSAPNMLAALLHDASEAYIGDMPSPIKNRLPDFKELEYGLMKCIAGKFGFQYPLVEEVREADKSRLEREWELFVIGYENEDGLYNFSVEDFLTIFKALTTC